MLIYTRNKLTLYAKGGGNMNDVKVIYSETRGTWNVIVNGEWYYEGDYEQASEVASSFYYSDED